MCEHLTSVIALRLALQLQAFARSARCQKRSGYQGYCSVATATEIVKFLGATEIVIFFRAKRS